MDMYYVIRQVTPEQKYCIVASMLEPEPNVDEEKDNHYLDLLATLFYATMVQEGKIIKGDLFHLS